MKPLTDTTAAEPKAAAPALVNADADELARAATEGSVAAFEILYRSYAPIVLAYTQAALSADEAEDAAADAFLRALERLDTFDSGRGSFRVWLLSIARHLVIDRRRARRAQPMAPEEIEERLKAEPAEKGHLDGGPDPRLASQLGRLSPSQRQVVALRYLVGLTNEECGRVLGKSPATVRQHHHMAMRSLARALEPQGEGERRAETMSRLFPQRRRPGQSFSVLPRLHRRLA